MINPYQSIINYNEGDDFFDEHLKKMHIYEIFKGILDEFPENKVFAGVVRFILWGYTPQSEMLQTTGLAWGKLSEKIFKATGLDNKYFEDVAELGSDAVRSAIDRWMIFLNDENFKQYITFRDLRTQFLAASLFPLPKGKKKGSDEEQADDMNKMKVQIEAKMLAATYSNDLLKMMNDAREKFIQTQPKLKMSVSELNKVTHARSTKSTEEIFAGNG
jgi:hypothetical protein